MCVYTHTTARRDVIITNSHPDIAAAPKVRQNARRWNIADAPKCAVHLLYPIARAPCLLWSQRARAPSCRPCTTAQKGRRRDYMLPTAWGSLSYHVYGTRQHARTPPEGPLRRMLADSVISSPQTHAPVRSPRWASGAGI